MAGHYNFEHLIGYCSGGYHPVHLHDTFKDGLYTVVHKLSFGTYSTVWLVKNNSTGKYAALKILIADVGKVQGSLYEEIKVLSHLQSAQGDGKKHVMQMIDHFEHKGPNGVHHCIVTELLGPPLSTDIDDMYPREIYPPPVAKRFVQQISYGVRFLHKQNVVHGDLHWGNILLYSPKIAQWSTQQDVEDYLGKPERHELQDKSAHVPDYLVWMPDSTPLLHLCLDDPTQACVKISDFSESFLFDPATPPVGRRVHMPMIYRAPEVMLDSMAALVAPGPSTDVWALAVLFHVIFAGSRMLFLSPAGREDELLREMVFTLGKLPEPIWSSWPNRKEYFDDDCNYLGNRSQLLYYSGKFVTIDQKAMGEPERGSFVEMLKSMVHYDPAKRAKMDEVVAAQWWKWVEPSTKS